MKIRLSGLAVLSLMAFASAAHAIVIDQTTFKKNGGDPSNILRSIKTANNKLRNISYSSAWLSVGNLDVAFPSPPYNAVRKNCTATWIGNKEGWSYFLTAAHCVHFYQGSTESPISGKFTDWRGWAVAQGNGVAYVKDPNVRVGTPILPSQAYNTASSQIAIVKLPMRNPIMDTLKALPLKQPILNDSALNEKGQDTIFVGYGEWGVGLKFGPIYLPAKGARRLYGRSQIFNTFDNGRGVDALYQPTGASPNWAEVTNGDDGAAWWQIHNKLPVIVAVTDTSINPPFVAPPFTNKNIGSHAFGARVSQYVDWIKSIYPDAKFLSDEQPQGCIVSKRFGTKYCLPAGKESPASNWPAWLNGQDIYVQADSGVSVQLSNDAQMDSGAQRSAEFFGTVETDKLKHVKANNGQYLDFSKPRAMRVTLNSKPLGCIVSLENAEKYCLTAGERSNAQLPNWIKGQDVFVQADNGVAVRLSDRPNFAFNRVATFSGTVTHENLKNVRAEDGENLDFSQPVSMEVIQQ